MTFPETFSRTYFLSFIFLAIKQKENNKTFNVLIFVSSLKLVMHIFEYKILKVFQF